MNSTVEIIKTGNKYNRENQQNKSWFFKMINRIDQTLTKLILKKERVGINNQYQNWQKTDYKEITDIKG